MRLSLYLGPPGTGKTTTLISIVEKAISSGTDPDKIGYISFTKAAVEEAIKRVRLAKEDLTYFRTLHSMCFRLCGLSTNMVMTKDHYLDVGERLGVEMTGRNYDRASIEELPDGDKANGLIDLAKLRTEPLRVAWERLDPELNIDWALVDLVDRALRKYKENNFLVDYTDMLSRYLEIGPVPKLDLLVVDEAQDLSRLQWRLLDKLSSDCQHLIIGGDDDQAIYRWAGVDVENLVEASRKADEVQILSQSYRLPRLIHRLSSGLSKRIMNRLEKEFNPKDEDGVVERASSLEEVNLSEGKWFILVRNRYMAAPLVEACIRDGFLYDCFGDSPGNWPSVKSAWAWENLRKGNPVKSESLKEILRFMEPKGDKIKLSFLLGKNKSDCWMKDLHDCGVNETRPWFEALSKIPSDDAEYIRAALRRGERLKERPRIRINTIHGAKVGEEDNVLLLTDQSYRTWKGMTKDPDDEVRVFYVGATRAKKRLVILQPQSQYYFDI